MAVLGLGFWLLANYFIGTYASYHWKVTEKGRISSQVENSGFPLTRQDDLLALLEQEQRLKTVSKLYDQLISLKRSIDRQWAKIEQEGDLEERLYSSDIDCLIGEIPLSQYNLNTEFLDYGKGSRPKMKRLRAANEPDCTAYSKLDFSMRTFPHLETLSKRNNFNLSMNPVPSKRVVGLDIDAMLRVNSSDWTAYNLASLYWRTVGNGTSALECAKRAVYFSPRNLRYIVLLNLGTLLQELESLGEAAIVLHSAVDHDPVQDVSHLALGNVYTALGDYKRSLACYDNVLSLNPSNIRALQLKHALLCHRKLESGLLEIHAFLQKILKDLQKHNALHEKWLNLQNQVNWERNSKVKEFLSVSQPIYLNLQMLLQNVENQAKSLNDEVSRRVPRRKGRKGAAGEEGGRGRRKGDAKCGARKEGGEAGGDVGGEFVWGEKGAGEEGREEETDLASLLGSDFDVDSLLSSEKGNYEEEMRFVESRRKMGEKLELVGRKSYFSLDGPLSFKDVESCGEESDGVKKLN